MMKRFTALLLTGILLLSLFPAAASAAALSADANKYDFFTSYCGTPNASGVNTYSECYQTSDFIPVKAGDTVTAGPFRDGQTVYATVYKSDKQTVVKQITALSGLTNVGDLNGAGYIRSYTVPANGAYVRLTLGAEYYNTFYVSVNAPFTAAEYTAMIAAEGKNAYLDFARASKTKFSGKKLIAVGDSVGHGSYEKNYEGADKNAVKIAFAGRMKNLLGFGSYTNAAAGGATFTDKHSTRILKQINNNAKADTEYLLIEGGMVDLYAYAGKVEPCGYLSASFDPATFAPENTFIGGLERSLHAATTNSPNAVIAFLIPYEVHIAYAGMFGWDRLFQYIPIVCEKWGVPVIDLYHNEAVNRVMNYVDDIGPNLVFWDNLHCAPHTYTACSLEAAMQFLNLPKYDKNNRKTPTNIPANIAKATWACPEPKTTPARLSFPENLYTGNNLTASTDGNSIPFITTDYIAVNPGDVITFGPVTPYTKSLVQLFDSSKKNVSKKHIANKVPFDTKTPGLTTVEMTLAHVYANGRLALQYTVPAGVKYVKVTFPKASAPVVTVNHPYTEEQYNGWVTSFNSGKPVVYTAPETTASPVTTKAPETTKAPVTTQVPVTTKAPETTAVPTTPAPETTVVPTTAAVTTKEVTTQESTTAAITEKAPEVSTAAPTDPSEPVTTEVPTETDAPATGAPAATSDDEVPEPGIRNGCFSFCGSAAAICLAALPLLLRRRRK